MDEQLKRSDLRPGRVRGKAAELEADSVLVTYSPAVLRGFARIEAAVHNSQHFDSDILQNLQGYTGGESRTVQDALTGVALITEQTMRHINATGDKAAEEALDDLTCTLLGLNPSDGPPIKLQKSPPKRMR